MMDDRAWRTRVLVGGAVLGALTGLGAAYILLQKAEKANKPVKVGASEGVKLGMIVLGLLRQIGQLVEGD